MAAPQPSTQAKRPLCISDEERAELLAKYRKLTPPSPAQERAEQLAKYRKLMPLPKAQPATEASTSTEALGTHAASDHLSTFTFSAKLSSSGWPSHPARWEAKLKQLGPDDAQYAYPYELPTSVDALPEWLRKKMDAEVNFQRQIEDACDVAEAEQAAKDEADPSRGLPGYWDEGYPSDDDQPRYEDGDWPSHLLGDEESADAIFCGRWEDLELTIEVSRGRHVTRLYRGSVDFQVIPARPSTSPSSSSSLTLALVPTPSPTLLGSPSPLPSPK